MHKFNQGQRGPLLFDEYLLDTKINQPAPKAAQGQLCCHQCCYDGNEVVADADHISAAAIAAAEISTPAADVRRDARDM